MKFMYSLADVADCQTFEEAVSFIIEKLHFKPGRRNPEDVDGSIKQDFTRDDGNLVLISDAQVDSVDIISDIELPIECLHKWTM